MGISGEITHGLARPLVSCAYFSILPDEGVAAFCAYMMGMMEMMMTDLDQLLGTVRALPTDARLANIDAAVMCGLAKQRDRTTARRSLMLAGLLAVGIGWAGSVLPGVPAHAAPTPIGMSDYAPSRLLDQ